MSCENHRFLFSGNPKFQPMKLSQPKLAEPKNGNDDQNHGPSPSPSPSILSGPEKVLSIIIVTTMTFLGPAPMSIYFPILSSLSRDLHVSPSRMSLTITVYMVCFMSESQV
jgi:hypothetical protein